MGGSLGDGVAGGDGGPGEGVGVAGGLGGLVARGVAVAAGVAGAGVRAVPAGVGFAVRRGVDVADVGGGEALGASVPLSPEGEGGVAGGDPAGLEEVAPPDVADEPGDALEPVPAGGEEVAPGRPVRTATSPTSPTPPLQAITVSARTASPSLRPRLTLITGKIRMSR